MNCLQNPHWIPERGRYGLRRQAVAFPLRCALGLALLAASGITAEAAAAVAVVASVVGHERSCGIGHPCTIGGADGGTYYLAFPARWDGKRPLKPFVFFHGHNGSGAGEIRNRMLVDGVTGRGFLMIAPDGPMFSFRGQRVRGWAARPEDGNPRGGRNDIRFVEKVLAEVARRYPVLPAETVVSGFSSGGSMAWYFSCYSKMKLAGVYAVSGALRRPLPAGGAKRADGSIAARCPGGPRRLMHLHGFVDRVVPLEGRGIRNWHQGDVFEALAVQRNTNSCRSRPDTLSARGPFWCRSWTSCESRQPVRFCLHPGGHGIPPGWLELGMNWLTRPQAISGR